MSSSERMSFPSLPLRNSPSSPPPAPRHNRSSGAIRQYVKDDHAVRSFNDNYHRVITELRVQEPEKTATKTLHRLQSREKAISTGGRMSDTISGTFGTTNGGSQQYGNNEKVPESTKSSVAKDGEFAQSRKAEQEEENTFWL